MFTIRIIQSINIIIFLLTILLSTNLFASSVSKKIVLESQDGERKLFYDCNRFRHQVKEGGDIKILMQYISSTMKGLVQNNDVVTARALEVAFDREDIRRIEKIVVEYRCGLK
jgi:hypothetical protein